MPTVKELRADGLPEDIYNEANDYSDEEHLSYNREDLERSIYTMRDFNTYPKPNYWYNIALFINRTKNL